MGFVFSEKFIDNTSKLDFSIGGVRVGKVPHFIEQLGNIQQHWRSNKLSEKFALSKDKFSAEEIRLQKLFLKQLLAMVHQDKLPR